MTLWDDETDYKKGMATGEGGNLVTKVAMGQHTYFEMHTEKSTLLSSEVNV